MANALMVTMRGSTGTWAVYLMEEGPREQGAVVQGTGPLAGSVSTWEELDALAARHDIESLQIYGEGLNEMEKELGVHPS